MFIYIGITKGGKIKIGKTTNIARRTSQIKLQAKSYKQKYVYNFDIVDDSDLTALEDIIRAELAKLQFNNRNIKRFGNDWAKCSKYSIAKAHIETVTTNFEKWLDSTELKYTKVAQ